MERKDYAEKFMQVKNEILEEIRKLIPYENAHQFKEPFCIHYVNGEVATNELCKAVEVWSDGMVVFIVDSEEADLMLVMPCLSNSYVRDVENREVLEETAAMVVEMQAA